MMGWRVIFSEWKPPTPYFRVPKRIRSRRQYVAWTKRARDILVKHHGYPAGDFIRIGDNEPSMNWCPLYPKHWERGCSSWLDKLPRGAVLYWPSGTDICGEAHDPEDPILMLSELQYWEFDFEYEDEEDI
jgi:hypothetical protein